MDYRFFKGSKDTTLVLLHGTGGDMLDLLDVAKFIDEDSNILALRGDVKENGMNRFFKRFSNGEFDYNDLIIRTNSLVEFLTDLSEKYNFNKNKLIGLGYSNGANMLASLILNIPNSINKAILLHPANVNTSENVKDLSNVNVFISIGKNDPIINPENAETLVNNLKMMNANVELVYTDHGHRITETEIIKVKNWLSK